MYRKEKEQLQGELEHFISSNISGAEEKIVVFGAGVYSNEIIGYLGSHGIPVNLVVDNDSRKIGLYCRGVRIASPDELDNILIEKAVFIICSVYWREMKTQLLGMGVKDRRIYTIVLKSFKESEIDCLKDLYRGRGLYKRLIKNYPDKKIFLCPYTGTGDIYLIGCFFKQYIDKLGIRDYVFIVVSYSCEMVAEIFPINNIVRIDGPEACATLVKYYMVFPDRCDIAVLNDSWADIYTNPIQWIRGLHGMHFTEMFRRFVFDLDSKCRPEHPMYKDVHGQVDRLCDELNLIEGRTVVLAPYATTLADMPVSFWEDIAKWMVKQGYEVCTNCGSSEEKEIIGTKRISFPLNIAPQIIERAGYFIGIRSGLCDVISGTNATKIILYDKANYFFNCSAYDYFSLRKMGLSDDAIEIEYDNTNIEDVKEEICRLLEISIG